MADRMLAAYEHEDALAAAIRRLRARGYRALDAYLPFPALAVEAALTPAPSRLPYLCFWFGMLGAGAAYALQWLLNGVLYPLVVGGRPPHFPLTFVPITFEMGVLVASFTAFIAVLWRGRLVRLTDEVQGTPGFESATRDRFWLEVSAADPAFDLDRTRADLAETGALQIELPEVGP
jgi:ActD protein